MNTPRCLLVFVLGAASAAGWAQSQSSGSQVNRDREFSAGAWLEPDLAHGSELYQTCAACHGQDGRGTEDGEIPAIAGQHGSVLLKQLTDFRNDQRWNERMENFTDRHHLEGPQDLTDVAAYVMYLPRFPPTAKGIGDGRNLGAGASVYFQECERCHGPLGEGDLLLNRPRLAGQHYAYLLRQMQDTATGHRPGMDRAHVERLQGLTPEEMQGVADYLSRTSPALSSSKRR
jgi:cytochrome c553